MSPLILSVTKRDVSNTRSSLQFVTPLSVVPFLVHETLSRCPLDSNPSLFRRNFSTGSFPPVHLSSYKTRPSGRSRLQDLTPRTQEDIRLFFLGPSYTRLTTSSSGSTFRPVRRHPYCGQGVCVPPIYTCLYSDSQTLVLQLPQ